MDEAFLLGTDVSEAFHQVPLHESERQFTVAALAGKYYVFKVWYSGRLAPPPFGEGTPRSLAEARQQ